MATLGLDIGGANLKAACGEHAATLPFPLYRQPELLAAALRRLGPLMGSARLERLAVTMTGELCDCFATKKDGVRHILAAVASAFPGLPIRVWTTSGTFVSPHEAEERWLATASANWLALATFAGRFVPSGDALLIDIGTTTADFIPLRDGVPLPRGRTDLERLASGELVYRGWRRTPACVLYPEGAAELFATTLDVCLALSLVPDSAADTDTADGQPATREAALRRLARLRCADLEMMGEAECVELARLLHGRLLACFRGAGFQSVWAGKDASPSEIILAGSGAFLLADELPGAVRLSEQLGAGLSEAACAHAVAMLAEAT